MAVIRTKPGVVFGGFTRPLLRILEALLEETGPIVITSASDGRHRPDSRHYTFEAVDVRSRSFPTLEAKQSFCQRLRARLGPDYDVILERVGQPSEHIHIEYDPPRPSRPAGSVLD